MHMQSWGDSAGERCKSVIRSFGGPAEVKPTGLFEDSAQLDSGTITKSVTFTLWSGVRVLFPYLFRELVKLHGDAVLPRGIQAAHGEG